MNVDDKEIRLLHALVNREIMLMEIGQEINTTREPRGTELRTVYFQLKGMEVRLRKVARDRAAQAKRAARHESPA